MIIVPTALVNTHFFQTIYNPDCNSVQKVCATFDQLTSDVSDLFLTKTKSKFLLDFYLCLLHFLVCELNHTVLGNVLFVTSQRERCL